jgi:hypothetical protein
MVSAKITRRGGNTAPNAMKGDEQHILLARGLSARYTGANAPLSGLTSEEMERDIRHMEAFANACTAYSQQYFIYQNSQEEKDANDGAGGGSGTVRTGTTPSAVPLVAMPVRIDPEEEKRLFQLRTKIQQCEGQREVLESQYLSLRAHYVHLSQVLQKLRGTVNVHVELLQGLVQKRGKLLGLQRVRLQIVREILACLKHRQSHPKPLLEKENTATEMEQEEEEEEVNLANIWNTLDDQITKAAQDCRSDGVEAWHALKVPRTPPGVPILLSQLATKPGHGVAFGMSGAFGTFPGSMCWLESNLPKAPTPGVDLPGLRDQVGILQRDLDNERDMNKELQSDIIARRKRNDELVAMMTLLRTETEAVVARHNILLDSDQAKDAAYNLHQKDQQQIQIKNKQEAAANALAAAAAAAETVVAEIATAAVVVQEGATTTTPKTGDAPAAAHVPADAAVPETPATATTTALEALLDASSATAPAVAPVTTELAAATTAESTVSRLADDENDGDDEGEIEEDDDEEGEILEQAAAASKRPLEEEGEAKEPSELGGSPRSVKRRKV